MRRVDYLCMLSYFLIWIGSAILLKSCGNGGCENIGDDYERYDNIPRDIFINTVDSSSRLLNLCYPQVNNKCIGRGYADYQVSGALLRGFDETIIALTLENGTKEMIHLKYRKEVYHSDCKGRWDVGFKDVMVISTTIEKYDLSNVSFKIIKY